MLNTYQPTWTLTSSESILLAVLKGDATIQRKTIQRTTIHRILCSELAGRPWVVELKALLVLNTNLKSWGRRSFSWATPSPWNTLPISLKITPSLTNLKKGLKTHQYKLAYE